MEFTGERFVPEAVGDIALEHKHRYLLAAIYARGKDVLDIASGEGYGSAILANVAKTVVGVDISPEAVAHAQRKYAAHNLQYHQGNAAAIPLPDASVDLVVSFETIEHHDKHEEMLKEIKRVLRPNGILCISSPDHYEYSVVPGYNNEFHCKELTREEFENLLGRYFARYKMTGQRIIYGSAVTTEGDAANFIAWDANAPIQSHAIGIPRAVYLLALASDGELPELFSSLLEARVEDSNMYRILLEADQDRKNRFCALEEEFHTLEDAYRALEDAYKALEDAYRALEGTHRTLEDGYRALEDAYRVLEDETRREAQRFRIIRRLHSFYSRVSAGMLLLVRRVKSGIPSLRSIRDKRTISGEASKAYSANCVQERIAAHKTGESLPSVVARDVRIYAAAAGNLFFLEIARLIQGGFADIGIPSTVIAAEALDDCTDSANADADIHVVIAPHEFFHFIPQAASWPHAKGKKWILNTEQAHTSWFAGAKEFFSWADLVLDMDQDLAGHLSREGFRAEHLPLGFSSSCRIFDGLAPVPLISATGGIPQRIRNWVAPDNPLDGPLHARPLDYCFFGTSTERRTAFFARHASVFANLEGFLRLKPLSGPLQAGSNAAILTEATSSIIRRSKISLNIHQSQHCYFEWHRIVLQGFWQGALVLSEPCTSAWPFRPNIEYVSVDLDNLADALEYLLLSDEGKAFAERVRRQAYITLTERCRMGDRLKELLSLHLGSSGELG